MEEVYGPFKYFKDNINYLQLELKPVTQLSDSGTLYQKKVKKIWNNYGGLLKVIAVDLSIELSAIVAVLTTESGGIGFIDNRLLIRFENHIFYKYISDKNLFNKFFKFNTSKTFTGHMYRKLENSDWHDSHKNQDSEWDAFEFAKSLSQESAEYSISMGLPQIMGFNHNIIGHNNSTQMIENFSKSEHYHILGFLDFISVGGKLMPALKSKDFKTFAKYYNGNGQIDTYAGYLQNYYNAFKSLGDL